MGDQITILDSSEQEKNIAVQDIGTSEFASKVVLVDVTGDTYGYHDDEIALPVQVTEDVFHYAVHEGLGFSAYAIATSGDQHICFTTPNTDIYLHLLWSFRAEDNATFSITEGCTANGSSDDTVAFCKNRALGMEGRKTSGIKAGNSATAGSYQASGAFTGGTVIYSEFTSKNGGSDNASMEVVLEKNTTYGFKLADIGTKDLGMTLTWFEIPAAS